MEIYRHVVGICLFFNYVSEDFYVYVSCFSSGFAPYVAADVMRHAEGFSVFAEAQQIASRQPDVVSVVSQLG